MASYVLIEDFSSDTPQAYRIPYRFFGKHLRATSVSPEEHPDLEVAGDIQLVNPTTNEVIRTVPEMQVPGRILEQFQEMYSKLYEEAESAHYDAMYDRIKDEDAMFNEEF